jgi:hypothetical protein
MNLAPTSTPPRAARRTSCLGTFLLVLVLWSFSVVALATYLVTRSVIVRQVRFAWWTVFLAAAVLLGVEVAVFKATGNGLVDLLRLHIHPWWLLLHGYGIGSLVTWPLTILACQAPLSLPVGAMLGSVSVARGERLAAGAEWSPYSQRQALVAEVHAVRHVARATRRHHEPTNPAQSPALGIAYPGGDLYPWLRKRGRITEVVIPAREQRLAMAVLGIPGSGKTVTLQRRVWIAARVGMRVVFVDCKGTDPALAWQVTCAYRLANPGAIVGFWPTQPLDCWRGDGMAIANRLLAVEDWAAEGGGVYYRRMATLALQLACTPPSGHPEPATTSCAGWMSASCSSCGAATRPPRPTWSNSPPTPRSWPGCGAATRPSSAPSRAPSTAAGAWRTSTWRSSPSRPSPAAPTPMPPSAWSWKTSATSPPNGRPGWVMTCSWSLMSSRLWRAAPTRPFTSPNGSATSASRSSSAPNPPKASATNANSGGCCTPSAAG